MRWLVLIALIPGCVFFFDDDDDLDHCNLAEPAVAPAPLRNPETLQCESYGGGCDPACGPCPLSPQPTWGICGDPCEALDPTACADAASCRVVLDARCEINGNCLTDFVGCFPVDQTPDTSVNCYTADAWQCSRSNECTALHSYVICPADGDAPCDRQFELCIPEGTTAGRCYDQVTCRAVEPECPVGTTPGVANGCWTRACIPTDLCEPVP